MWELHPGDLVDGKYEVLERLHAGSMGDVYLVRHVHLQAMRVIKVLRPEVAADQELAERFRREARTATRVEHPHVATLHDFSQLDDGSFLTIWEYIQGETVADWLGRSGRVPVVTALELADQALRGLGAIHSAGVLHRDLSPDNLVLSHDPSGGLWLKIIDLGLSQALPVSDDGEAGGKISYCSPEQAAALPGVVPDHRSDLYSFGLVLYEMLCGESAFDSTGLVGGLEGRFRRGPISLGGRVEGLSLPSELESVVMKALAGHPVERWQSAAEFAEALTDVRNHLDLGHGSEEGLSSSAEGVDVATLIGRADEAIREGRLDEAAAIVDGLESIEPPPLGVAELRRLLSETHERRRRMQVLQTEELLEQYLLAGRKALAEMALGVLVELDPGHGRRSELEWRVESLSAETGSHSRPEMLEAATRRSLARSQLSEARDWLERFDEVGGSAKTRERLWAEIEEAERAERRQVAADRVKARLEELLESGRVETAEKELAQLEELEVPKAVLGVYRGRIDSLRGATRRRWHVRMVEMRFPQLLERRAWQEAREAAQELRDLDPESDLPAKMMGEISRREDADDRNSAIDAGVETVERYLDEGRLQDARTALDVLERLAPEHEARPRLEAELKVLESRAAGLRSEDLPRQGD